MLAAAAFFFYLSYAGWDGFWMYGAALMAPALYWFFRPYGNPPSM
jgi:hypothetical protein